jgi:hypothetical protein
LCFFSCNVTQQYLYSTYYHKNVSVIYTNLVYSLYKVTNTYSRSEGVHNLELTIYVWLTVPFYNFLFFPNIPTFLNHVIQRDLKIGNHECPHVIMCTLAGIFGNDIYCGAYQHFVNKHHEIVPTCHVLRRNTSSFTQDALIEHTRRIDSY